MNMHEVDYDLESALEYNQNGGYKNTGSLVVEDIKGEIAVVYGENDEYYWHWIVALKDGRFAYITGECDYTGWDCSSTAGWHIANTLEEIILLTPITEEYTGRNIRGQLINQIYGIQPFGTYKINYRRANDN